MRKITKLIIILIIGLLSSINPISAAGKNHYFLNFFYNSNKKIFTYEIKHDSTLFKSEDLFSMLNSNKSSFLLDERLNPPEDLINLHGIKDFRPYTFPEFFDVDGGGNDQLVANVVGHDIVLYFNKAIEHILKPVSKEGLLELKVDEVVSYLKMSAAISNTAHQALTENKTVQGQFNKLIWTMAPLTENEFKAQTKVAQGSSINDWIAITNYSDKTIYLPYKIPKGYGRGQTSENLHPTFLTHENITEKISWAHVVYLSNQNIIKGNMPNIKQNVFNDPFSKVLSNFIDSVADSITRLLGMYTTEELFFNRGNRELYWYGIFPFEWMRGINVLYLFASIMGLITMGISIAGALIKRNIAAIFPDKESSLKVAALNGFIMLLSILLFMPVLIIVLKVNESLITALYNISPINGNALGIETNDITGLIKAIISIAYLFILLNLNIKYIIRSVILALLIGFAPLFMSLYFNKSTRKITLTWVKEMFSNILLQSFHALMLLIYSTLSASVELPLVVQVALLISFIPLTRFFKNNLMGLNTASDEVSDKAASVFSDLALGMATGAVMSKADGNQGQAKAQALSKGRETPSFNSPINNFKENKEQLKGSLNGKEIMNRLTYGTTMMVAGSVISLGSASTGGSIMAGSGVFKKGFKELTSLNNNNHREESIETEHAGDLDMHGFSGFMNDNKTLMLNDEAYLDINSSPHNKETFIENVKTFHPDAEVVKNQYDKHIIGVKLPGVTGKTMSINDIETNKPLLKETAYKGKPVLDNFKHQVMSKAYRKSPEE